MLNIEQKIRQYRNRKIPPIKTYWWRPADRTYQNFGDELTALIVRQIWGLECERAEVRDCELVGAGSVIEFLQRATKGSGRHVKVWGSGFIHDGPQNSMNNLEFFAVRGKKSRARITSQNEVALGDPGLLTSLAIKELPKKYKVGLVPHYADKDNPKLSIAVRKEGFTLINPLLDPHRVVCDITSCELILSSSLHGLIVADSYGIPNYWMPLSSLVTGGSYKYEDNNTVTGRGELVRKTPDILTDNEAIDDAIMNYQQINNLKSIQKNLIKAFPFQ